jgi:hypothetical protein
VRSAVSQVARPFGETPVAVYPENRGPSESAPQYSPEQPLGTEGRFTSAGEKGELESHRA